MGLLFIYCYVTSTGRSGHKHTYKWEGLSVPFNSGEGFSVPFNRSYKWEGLSVPFNSGEGFSVPSNRSYKWEGLSVPFNSGEGFCTCTVQQLQGRCTYTRIAYTINVTLL